MANTEIYYLLEDLGESSGIDLDELLSNWLGIVRLRHGPQLTCNLFRSFPNCWNPSSSVTKVAESFEDAEVRACITRFLSNKVLSRSLSFGAMSEASKSLEFPCYLCFLLKVEDIDLLKFALLINNMSTISRSSNEGLAY